MIFALYLTKLTFTHLLEFGKFRICMKDLGKKSPRTLTIFYNFPEFEKNKQQIPSSNIFLEKRQKRHQKNSKEINEKVSVMGGAIKKSFSLILEIVY